MKEEKRLMMSEEEVRERAKELLNMPREELITNHLFFQQENQHLEEVIKEASECVKRIILSYHNSKTMIPSVQINKLEEILSKGENK